jgi:dipeptidase E
LTSWEYVRVEALGILPGLVCPHFDKTQSNGVLRAADFDAMLKRYVLPRHTRNVVHIVCVQFIDVQ